MVLHSTLEYGALNSPTSFLIIYCVIFDVEEYSVLAVIATKHAISTRTQIKTEWIIYVWVRHFLYKQYQMHSLHWRSIMHSMQLVGEMFRISSKKKPKRIEQIKKKTWSKTTYIINLSAGWLTILRLLTVLVRSVVI